MAVMKELCWEDGSDEGALLGRWCFHFKKFRRKGLFSTTKYLVVQAKGSLTIR